MRLKTDLRLVDQLGLSDVAAAKLAPAIVAAVTGRPLSPGDREHFADLAENACGQHMRDAYLAALLAAATREPSTDDDDDHPNPLTPPSPWRPPQRPGQ